MSYEPTTPSTLSALSAVLCKLDSLQHDLERLAANIRAAKHDVIRVLLDGETEIFYEDAGPDLERLLDEFESA